MAQHDQSYKKLFRHPELVRDLFMGFVEEEWVFDLDFSTLNIVSDSYVSDDLRDREDDIIWRVRFKGEWLYVYILIEFQSTVDKFMAVRLITYVGLLYQDLIASKEIKAGDKLPPVFPVVLYNGGRRWTAPLEIRELIADVPEGLSCYLPCFKYYLIEEQSYSDERLLGCNLASAVFRLEKSRTFDEMREVVDDLISWLRLPEQASLRRVFTTWIKRVLLSARLPDKKLPEPSDLLEVSTMLAERVKQWTEEWKQQGLQEGRMQGHLQGLQEGRMQGLQEGRMQGLQEGRMEGRMEGHLQGLQEGRMEGRIEGRIEGQRLLLKRLLQLKFGGLGQDIEAMIDSASEESLMDWLERIMKAKTISDVMDTKLGAH